MTDERGAKVRFPPPLLAILPLGLALALHYLVLPLPIPFPGAGPLEGSVLRMMVGALVTVLGLTLMASGILQFRKTGNDPDPWSAAASLMDTGIFRYTRNPLYVGLEVAHIGLAVAFGSWWAIASVVPSMMLVHFLAVLPEETYLEDKFGADFDEEDPDNGALQ